MVDWLKSGVPKSTPTPKPTPQLKAYVIRYGWTVYTVYCDPGTVTNGGMVQTYLDKKGKTLGRILPAKDLNE